MGASRKKRQRCAAPSRTKLVGRSDLAATRWASRNQIRVPPLLVRRYLFRDALPRGEWTGQATPARASGASGGGPCSAGIGWRHLGNSPGADKMTYGFDSDELPWTHPSRRRGVHLFLTGKRLKRFHDVGCQGKPSGWIAIEQSFEQGIQFLRRVGTNGAERTWRRPLQIV